MATIINTPRTADEGTGTGVVIGILAVVLLVILFLLFGLPYLRDRGVPQTGNGGANINVQLPDTGSTNPSGSASGGTSGTNQ
jgi:hypothetical protein